MTIGIAKIHSEDMDHIQEAHDQFIAQADLNTEAAQLQDKAYMLGLERGKQSHFTDHDLNVIKANAISEMIGKMPAAGFNSDRDRNNWIGDYIENLKDTRRG